MVRKKIGVFSLLSVCMLLMIMLVAAQLIIDLGGGFTGESENSGGRAASAGISLGGKIADGIESPFGCGTLYAYAASASPTISKVEIADASESYQAGSSFKLALTLGETELTFSGSCAVFMNKDTGATFSAGSDKTALADNRYITVTIPDSVKGGEYIIERIVLLDSEGNTHIFYNPDNYEGSYSAKSKTKLTEEQRVSVAVVSNSSDTSAPQISALEIEKNDAVKGEELIFAVEAKDVSQTGRDIYNKEVTYAATGLNSIRINWQRAVQDGDKDSLLSRYTFSATQSFADMKQNGDIWQGTFKIPSRLVAGTYFIASIVADDKAGNTAVYVNPDFDTQDTGSADAVYTLDDEISALFINVTSDGSTVSAGSAKSAASNTRTGKADASSDTSVVIPVVQSFQLNSFGKMAAYVVLNAQEENGEIEAADEEAKAYTALDFRFSASADTDTIGEDNSLSVGLVVGGDTYENARNVVKSKSVKSVVFDISLLDSVGTAVQPDGVVSISTDLPENYDTDKISVYRLSDDGKKCYKLDSTVTGERVTFTTEHFSVFIIAQDADTTSAATLSPRTADDAALAALAFVLAGAFAVCALNYRKLYFR